MRRSICTVLSLLLAVQLASAQPSSSSFITQYPEFQQWLPIVILSILASVCITAIYYIIAVFLNNRRMKSRAVSELGQTLGTGILMVAIIAVLTFFGTGILSQVPAISPSSLQQICGPSQLGSSQVAFLRSEVDGYAPTSQVPGASCASGQNYVYVSDCSNPAGTFTSTCSSTSTQLCPSGGWGNEPSPTETICTEIANGAGSTTDSIDYGLFASYLIIANMTNQTLSNLNSLYKFEGWVGFADQFTAETQVCEPVWCAIPIFPRATSVEFSFRPLAGFDTLKKSIDEPSRVQAVLTFYMFYVQLMVSIIILYLWPWVLAAGIMLRASMFTRRAGGLIIALVLAWLLILPSIIVLEYSAATGTGLKPIGASSLPTLPLYTQAADGTIGVYGAPQLGGYVPSEQAQQGGCYSGDSSRNIPYTYETVCGYPGTVPKSSSYTDPSTGTTYTTCSSTGATCATDANGDVIPEGITINFFVFPKLADVLRYNSCLPDNLPQTEFNFAAIYLIPFYSTLTGILGAAGGLVSGLPSTPVDTGDLFHSVMGSFACGKDNAINSALAIANLYGVVGVAAYIMPLLNLIIVISAAVGISGLLGGDTDIIGLSKLL